METVGNEYFISGVSVGKQPIILTTRNWGMYYSDQLEVIEEINGYQVSFFTDRIGVVQLNMSVDTYIEYEVLLSGNRETDKQYLLQHFREITAHVSEEERGWDF